MVCWQHPPALWPMLRWQHRARPACLRVAVELAGAGLQHTGTGSAVVNRIAPPAAPEPLQALGSSWQTHPGSSSQGRRGCEAPCTRLLPASSCLLERRPPLRTPAHPRQAVPYKEWVQVPPQRVLLTAAGTPAITAAAAAAGRAVPLWALCRCCRRRRRLEPAVRNVHKVCQLLRRPLLHRGALGQLSSAQRQCQFQHHVSMDAARRLASHNSRAKAHCAPQLLNERAWRRGTGA